MGAVVAAIVVTIIASGREDAAKVLVKGDAGVPSGAGRIGIDGLEKVLDLLPNVYLLAAPCDALPWLDRVVHFTPHPTDPQRNLDRASKEA
jgi:hypothetical protein